MKGRAMPREGVCIPVGYAWTSPFVRWGGALADFSSLDVGAAVTRDALAQRETDPGDLTGIVLGWTVPQPAIFYGAPTLAAQIGAPAITGPMISQACATGAAALQAAAAQVDGDGDLVLLAAVDRTSNAPHLVYPSATRPGGAPTHEDWMLDNFSRDPWAGAPMIETAEAVAAEGGIGREAVDELTLMRYEQYESALADDRAAQRRYFVDVKLPVRKGELVVEEDAGVHPTTAEGLAKLKPASDSGVHTIATQTHPADAAAGMLVTTVERAKQLPGVRGIAHLLGFGWSRVEKARMPKAPVPAAEAALAEAGVTIDQVDVVTTHNPFAVNDLWFAQQSSFPLDRMNPYGCSLVYGHPQAPTGVRAITELLEALSERGGGIGLFTGCAAGDTAGAVVVRVD
jgi:acetyl-CoA C-acetyltransferase